MYMHMTVDMFACICFIHQAELFSLSTSGCLRHYADSVSQHHTAVAFLLLLYLTLTAKMEDSIAKLNHFSKLDFQTKRKVINNGRPMPELKGTLQTKLKGMLLTPHSLTLH